MGIGVETLLTSTILVYFAIASVFRLCKRQLYKPKSLGENDQQDENKEDTDSAGAGRPGYRFKRILAVLVALVIVIAIAEATVRGIQLGRLKKEADDNILADLLFGFSWTVLFLSLAESEHVTFVHQGACFLSFLLSIFSTAKVPGGVLLYPFTWMPRVGSSGSAVAALCMLRVFLVGLTLVLMCISTWLPLLSVNTDAERAPLLGGNDEAATNSEREDDDVNDDKSTRAAVAGIRNRQGLEYLKSFSVFLPYMWPGTALQKAQVAGMLVCSGLQRVTSISQPMVLGMVVNKLAESRSMPWKIVLIYVIVGLLNSQIGISMIQSALQMYLGGEQKRALRNAAYDHIMDLSAEFHDSKTSSYVWSAMYQASSTVGLILNVAFSIIPSIIDLIAGFVVLYTLFGNYMGLLVLATVVLFLWLTANALSPRADLYRKINDHHEEEHLQMSDSTENWYTVSECNQISYEQKQFRTLGKRVRDMTLTIWWYNERSSAIRYSLTTLAFAAACCLAATQIAHNEQKVGAFVTLTSYWVQLTGPLSQLVGQINSTSSKLVAAEKLLALLERKPKVTDNEETGDRFTFLGGQVEFDNVCFSYDGKRQASQGISFRAPAGTTTAIVGETGGGKSTILKLLFRFYDPQQGRVLIDGQDVRKLQLRSFRKHIGWVPQDAVPFNKTVLDNVRYSDLTLSEDAVRQACTDAALHDKIMSFTKQYQEEVGERGVKLSGGERQRLAIARALIKAPDILLLDEATSAVDSITEAKIQASIERLGKSKTTFVIAHRLSTILKADQILVIEKGRLVENGSHDELIRLGGAYKRLWDSQLKLQKAVIDTAAATAAAAAATTTTSTTT